MSTTVDQRVVEMKFDNSNFERNVKESMSTLDKLKAKLNFSDSGKAFESLEKAANGIKLGTLSDTLDSVSVSISGWGVMATRVLSNIADDVYSWAKKLSYSLSFENVFAGWTRYGEKTEAVQTIMAATKDSFRDVNTGLVDQEAQLEEVNYQLERLNWFTDETSYNFVDMVSNIGKFTANQVGLEEATTSMMGIANWAAISGANVQMASRAMYNLSQATGAGYLKLIDWKSIENANMATAEFKQAAIDAGVALGTLSKSSKGIVTTMDGTVVSVKNFSQTLSEGWLTAGAGSVIERTLNQYGAFTNALRDAVEVTGISATDFLVAIDDFQVGLGKGAEKAGVSMNKFSELFFQFRDGSITLEKAAKNTKVSAEELSVIFDEVAAGNANIAEMAEEAEMSTEDLVTTLAYLSQGSFEFGRNAFKAAQEAKTFQDAVNATKDAAATAWMNIFESIFGDYTQAKKVWTQLAGDLWDIFVEPVDRLQARLKEAFNTKYWWNGDNLVTSEEEIQEIVIAAAELNGELDLTDEKIAAMVMDWKASHEAIKGNEYIASILANSVGLISDALTIIRDAWRKVFAPESSMGLFYAAKNLSDFLENLRPTKEQIEKMSDALAGLFQIFKPIWDGIVIVSKIVGTLAMELGKLLADGIKPIFSWLADHLGTLAETENRSEKINNIVSGFRTTIQSLFNKIRSGAKLAATKIKSFWDSFKDTEFYKNTIGKLGEFLRDFFEKAKEYFKVGSDGSSQFLTDVDTAFSKIKEVFTNAKGWFSDTFTKIKDWFGIGGDGATSLKDKLGELWDTLTNNNPFTKIKDGVDSLKGENGSEIKFPVLDQIGQFFNDFSSKWEEFKSIFDSLSSSGGVSGWLSSAGNNISGGLQSFFSGFTASDAAGIATGAGFTASMLLFVDGVKKLTAMAPDISGLVKNLGTAIKQVGTSVSLYFNKKGWSEIGKSLLYVAGAVLVVAGAVFLLKDLDTDQLYKTLGAISLIVLTFGGLFLALGIMSKNMSANPSAIIKSMSMAMQLKSMALVMIGAVVVLKLLEKVDYDKVKQNMGMFSLVLGEMVAAMLLITNFTGNKGGILKFLGFSLSLLVLIKVFEKLGDMDLNKIENNLKDHVGGILATMLSLVAMCSLAGSGNGWGMLTMLALPGAMVMFGLSLMVLAKIMDKINFGALIVGLGLMWGVVKTFESLDGPNLNKSAIGIIAFAISIVLITKAMTKIMDAFSAMPGGFVGKLWTLSLALAGIATIVVLLRELMRSASALNGVKIWSLAATLLAFSGAIWIIAAVLMNLGNMTLGEIWRGEIALAGVVVTLLGMMGMLKSIDMSSITGIGKTMAGLVALVVILSFLMTTVGKLSKEEFNQAQLGVTIMMEIAGVLMGLMFAIGQLAKGEMVSTGQLLSIALIVALFGGIIYLLYDLAKKDTQALFVALAGLGGIVASLYFALVGLKGLSDIKLSPGKLITIASVIAIMAGILAGLIFVLGTGTSGGFDKLLPALVGLFAIMKLFAVFAKELKEVSNGFRNFKIKNMYAIVGIIAALGAILVAMVAVMSPAGGGGFNKLWPALVGLIAMCGLFVGLGFALKAMNKGFKGVQIAALYGIVGIITVLALVIAGLSSILGEAGKGGFNKLWPALVAIALGLTLVIGALAIMGALSGVMIAGAVALGALGLAIGVFAISVGAGALLIGTGAALIGAGIKLITDALATLASFSDADRKNIEESIVSVGTGIVNAIKRIALDKELGPAIGMLVGTIIGGIVSGIASAAGAIAASFGLMLIDALNGVADFINEHGGELIDAIKKFVSAIWHMILNAFKDLGKLEPVDPVIVHNLVGENFAAGLNRDTFYLPAETASELSGGGRAMGEQAVDEVKSGIEESVANSEENLAEPVAEKIQSDFKVFNFSDILSNGGLDISNLLSGSIIPNIFGDMGGSIDTGMTSIVDQLGGFTDDFGQAGADLGSSLVAGQEEEMDSKTPEMVDNTVDGLTEGFEKKADRLYRAGRGIASNIINGFNDRLAIASPSKIMKQEGGYVIAGLVNGLKDNLGTVTRAGEKVGSATQNAISDSIRLVSDMIEFTDYSQPVIRPVLDLTDVNNGLSSLSTGYGLSYALAGQNASAFGSDPTTELANKMDKFTTAITNLLNDPKHGGTVNNWNISGSDPMEVAEQVLLLMEDQVSRKENQWV